jgi:uncharacterized membrane protein YoaK (UPF0700 family)
MLRPHGLPAIHWHERQAFVIGITAAAGWLDALAFLHLGKVFNSIMTGNVLFVGLGAGNADGGLVLRAGVALAAFALAAFVGARIVGAQLTTGAAAERLTRALLIEGALLVAFAMIWLAIGSPAEHPALRVVLLGVGATAMGVQAAIALALKMPNIATVALTGTIAQLAALAGWRRRHDAIPRDVPSLALMAALILTYLVGAAIVALAPDWPALALGPIVLLGVATIGRLTPGKDRRHPIQSPA